MIPQHIIAKALDAWIGDHNCPHPDLIYVYRVLITRSLEAVATDIWDEGFTRGVNADDIDASLHETREIDLNPYRASETA